MFHCWLIKSRQIRLVSCLKRNLDSTSSVGAVGCKGDGCLCNGFAWRLRTQEGFRTRRVSFPSLYSGWHFQSAKLKTHPDVWRWMWAPKSCPVGTSGTALEEVSLKCQDVSLGTRSSLTAPCLRFVFKSVINRFPPFWFLQSLPWVPSLQCGMLCLME